MLLACDIVASFVESWAELRPMLHVRKAWQIGQNQWQRRKCADSCSHGILSASLLANSDHMHAFAPGVINRALYMQSLQASSPIRMMCD